MFKTWLFILSAALASLVPYLTASNLHAAEAVLKAPATIQAGQLVLLDATKSSATDSIEFRCPDSDVTCWLSHDRRSVVIRVPSSRLLLVGVIARDKGGAVHTTATAIEVTGDKIEPPKPDKPEPSKPIKPLLPAGRFGISQDCCNEAAKVDAARRADSLKVAEALKSVRTEIVAGAIDATKTREILAAITKANNRLSPETRRAWNSWGAWWGSRIKTLYDAGKLATKQDWVDVLDETIVGIVGSEGVK